MFDTTLFVDCAQPPIVAVVAVVVQHIVTDKRV